MKHEAAALPNNLQGWIPIILSALGALIIFIASLGVVQHQVDDQFISSDVLKQSLEQLQSYSEEGQLLARYTLSASAPKPYTSAYASALQAATDSLSEKLREHPHDRSLNSKIMSSIQLANDLARQLVNLSNQPRNQLSPSMPDHMGQISNEVQQLEEKL